MGHIVGTEDRGERCAVVICGRSEHGTQLVDQPVDAGSGDLPAVVGTRTPMWRRIAVPGRRPRALLELVVIAAMFGAYKLGRIVAAKHVGTAFDNAYVVWDLERILRLPDELSVQALMLKSTLLIKSANVYYVAVHFPATAAFLIWLYLRRPDDYLWVRRTLALLTASGLLVHLAIPVAPPRMLGQLGFIDTADVYGPAVYGPPAQNSLADQYAAMPSLHIGWAIAVAIGIIATTRTRWRWLAVAHPVVTTLVVIGTGNHFWLDGLVATGLLAVSLVVVRSYTDLTEPRIEVPDFVPVLDRPSERDRARADRAEATRADLAAADRPGIDRPGADLSGADLSVAALSVAELSGADLPDRMPPPEPTPPVLLTRPATERRPHPRSTRRPRSGAAGAEDLADVAGDRGDR